MKRKPNPVTKKISKVNELLIQKYGLPYRPQNPPDPLDMLIATILSQNTNDKNSFKAFTNLKEKYESWDKAADQQRSKIEKAIKIAGLGKQKSAAIKNVLTTLKRNYNRISLSQIVNKNDNEIISELISFDGVGLKTASCVLLFSLRRNICPVDTHVHRTANRIGIVKTKTPDKTFEILNPDLPDGVAHSFHTNLIRLGREFCKPAKPSCLICPLLNICEFDKKNLAEHIQYKRNDFLLLDNIK